MILPNNTNVVVIGYEEGIAGQISLLIEREYNSKIKFFLDVSTDILVIDEKKALDRPAKQFDFPKNGKFKGYEFYSSIDYVGFLGKKCVTHVIIALSDNGLREMVFSNLKTKTDIIVCSLIHPTAVIMDDAIIGEGVLIGPSCFVGYRSEIGNCSILQAGSHIDHHSVLGDFVNVYPRAVVAGNSLIGSKCTLCLNCTIINRIKISPGTIIGAGAVVVKNIEHSFGTYIGNPAKKLR